MILLVNLLIAIMSDQYARMSEKRIGLYWTTVIKEMPKYKYDKNYGVLVMMPFILSWIGMFSLPFLLCIKSRKKLSALNNIYFFIGFSFLTPFLIVIFMSVNLVLLPIAYFKTIVHKVKLVRIYRGKYQCINLLVFAVFGILLLLVT